MDVVGRGRRTGWTDGYAEGTVRWMGVGVGERR